MADPYATLGVLKNASAEEIRKAYRRLAKESHPDLNPGNAAAEKRFKEISAAYDILGDPEKRRRFDAGEIDATGAERPERHFYREYAGAKPGSTFEQGSAGAAGFEDLGDIFTDLFRDRGGRTRMRMRGGDVRYMLPVEFLEAVNGTRKRIDLPEGRTLDLTVPAGARDGQILRLQGQGTPGIGGGPPGDALIEIHVRPHPVFRREGNDIRSELPITLREAIAGGRLRVETVSGSVDLRIPKGSSSGKILRLRGKGAPDPASGQRGDHLVELKMVLPGHVDPELERFISDWESKHPYNPRT